MSRGCRRVPILMLAFVCLTGIGIWISFKNSPFITSSTTTSATSTKTLTRNQPWQHYQANRTLALIHIGKGGGLTLRAMTSLNCRLPRNEATPGRVWKCLQETFGTQQQDDNLQDPLDPLVFQTIYYAHMNSFLRQEMINATSWLLALRNPLDRVISAFEYSHPANCRDTELLPNATKGCNNHFILTGAESNHFLDSTTRNWNRKQWKALPQIRHLFVDCFPLADMEVFVQAALKRQPATTSNHGGDNQQQGDDCAQLARSYLLGHGPIFPIPHFAYNYQHYQTKALNNLEYGQKEWFAVRTEHLWQDFSKLNYYLGGGTTPTVLQQPIKLTHGSERYYNMSSASPILSTQTYQQLCCLLHQELSIYMEILFQSWNLDVSEKLDTIHSLAQKCAMSELVRAAASVTDTTPSATVQQGNSSDHYQQLWNALEVWKIQQCQKLWGIPHH